MVTSGVADSFRHNVRQVAASLICMARKKAAFKKEMKRYLDLRETEPRDEVVDEPSESNLTNFNRLFEEAFMNNPCIVIVRLF